MSIYMEVEPSLISFGSKNGFRGSGWTLLSLSFLRSCNSWNLLISTFSVMKAITAAAHDRIAQIHRDHPEMVSDMLPKKI